MNIFKKYRSFGIIAVLVSGFAISGFYSFSDAEYSRPEKGNNRTWTISKAVLKDKIKGGWAGQTIGVTFGWPTEFLYRGTFIQDYQKIVWHDDYVTEAMRVFPGLFDDVYMDLTFVDVYERYGLSAPADSFALAYARSGYELWHANQAGRYNILHGIPASKSGHWLNNPHADDIDFQIESDFAGLMSPGTPNAASAISDKTGHIMNYGDGWYGGVFVSNMYAQAFVNTDINEVVYQSLKAIPKQSKFYRCIADVIAWHKKYPRDWKQTWFEIQKKWAEERGCPEGVFHPLNIDAKLNAAYVVLGLLYGEGDFTKTMEISTRAGQDSDCNPSSAGGILGTMIGYDNIPAYWLNPLKKAEDQNFSYTNLSLNKVYELSFRHALLNVEANKGKVHELFVEIPHDPVKTVAFEESFAGHYPKETIVYKQISSEKLEFDFDGIGFVLKGYARRKNSSFPDSSIKAELIIDGQKMEEISLPTKPSTRRTDLCWRYGLSKGKHEVEVRVLHPDPGYELVSNDFLVYDRTDLPY